MAHKIIGGFETRCSACGGNADMDDNAHIRGGPKSMWSNGSTLADRNGCGAIFDEPPSSTYVHDLSRLDASEATR